MGMRIKRTCFEAFFKFDPTCNTQEKTSNYLKILIALKSSSQFVEASSSQDKISGSKKPSRLFPNSIL
jgi:hypothetical protein